MIAEFKKKTSRSSHWDTCMVICYPTKIINTAAIGHQHIESDSGATEVLQISVYQSNHGDSDSEGETKDDDKFFYTDDKLLHKKIDTGSWEATSENVTTAIADLINKSLAKSFTDIKNW